MSALEFREWLIYEKLEPFGDRRGDLQIGILSALTANVNRAPSKKAYSPSDFMPKWEDLESVVQTAEQQLAMVLSIKAKQDAFLASING